MTEVIVDEPPQIVEKQARQVNILSISTIFLVITVLTGITLSQLKFFRLFSRTSVVEIFGFFGQNFFPLSSSEAVHASIRYAMVETLQIALVGTYFGIFLSLPVSILAAKNLMPRHIFIPARLVLSAVRTVPSLIWALLFVISFGIGPRSGVIALAVYTMGYLGKFQYETFEGLPSDSIEALTALGAGKLQIIRYVVLPETANELISQVVFMFEYNVRASSIIGFVGAGGIGFLLANYIAYFQFQALAAALLYMLVIVVLIDFLGSKIRDQFQDPNFKDLNL
ncbi:MAG: phosphonate ABC transporter, permease protein PhnE [Candidatus Kariarchaeaceae archaeon]|jgi:phosphonate transport system permease protein